MVLWNSHVAILIILDVSYLHARFIIIQLFDRFNHQLYAIPTLS
jgi:hypothetical protein